MRKSKCIKSCQGCKEAGAFIYYWGGYRLVQAFREATPQDLATSTMCALDDPAILPQSTYPKSAKMSLIPLFAVAGKKSQAT